MPKKTRKKKKARKFPKQDEGPRSSIIRDSFDARLLINSDDPNPCGGGPADIPVDIEPEKEKSK